METMLLKNIEILLNFSVILIHTLVLFTLLKFRKNDVKGSRKCLLLSLYLDEIAYSIVSVTINLLSREPNITPQIRKHLTICRRALILIMYYLIMIYITIDRFLVIFLNIKYPVLWSPRKAAYLVLGSFSFSCIISFATSFSWAFYRWNASKIYHVYIYPILAIVFLASFLITYIYIFQKLRKNWREKKVLRTQLSQGSQTSCSAAAPNKSKFKLYAPTLIIFTFAIFVVVPNMIKIVDEMTYSRVPRFIRTTQWVLLPMGFLLDALICLYSSKMIQQKLKHYFRGKRTIDKKRRNTVNREVTYNI